LEFGHGRGGTAPLVVLGLAKHHTVTVQSMPSNNPLQLLEDWQKKQLLFYIEAEAWTLPIYNLFVTTIRQFLGGLAEIRFVDCFKRAVKLPGAQSAKLLEAFVGL
jgi:hypothetical protein